MSTTAPAQPANSPGMQYSPFGSTTRPFHSGCQSTGAEYSGTNSEAPAPGDGAVFSAGEADAGAREEKDTLLLALLVSAIFSSAPSSSGTCSKWLSSSLLSWFSVDCTHFADMFFHHLSERECVNSIKQLNENLVTDYY